jgi:hypothetical protein
VLTLATALSRGAPAEGVCPTMYSCRARGILPPPKKYLFSGIKMEIKEIKKTLE